MSLRILVTILLVGGTMTIGHARREVIRRTDWESANNGWLPPMPMAMPPKILLVKSNDEQSAGDSGKEDKLSSLLPIIMTLGPIILMAIVTPIFMSLFSGMMGFMKSMMSMKTMMPMTMTMNQDKIIPAISVLPPNENCGGQTNCGQSAILIQHIRARQQKEAVADIWARLDEFAAMNATGLSGALTQSVRL
ncbi:hypothetical protein JTE90_007936 [Oedothorax gibbosus]|uniref:Uncharacterized protein n=1 Tax=Oedothorax gibbosus TaxID=931172 RepID=A0AAV6VKX0_9ARAC|nr:hypothetical protein JTE90_007936 [Oedothorax gibbosus]